MVVFPPIFVADTKIIYGYNFVAPLKLFYNLSSHSRLFEQSNHLHLLPLYFQVKFNNSQASTVNTQICMYQPIRLCIHFYTVLHFNIPIQWFRCGKLVSIFIVYHIFLHNCINENLLVFVKYWYIELCWKLLFNIFEHNTILT